MHSCFAHRSRQCCLQDAVQHIQTPRVGFGCSCTLAAHTVWVYGCIPCVSALVCNATDTLLSVTPPRAALLQHVHVSYRVGNLSGRQLVRHAWPRQPCDKGDVGAASDSRLRFQVPVCILHWVLKRNHLMLWQLMLIITTSTGKLAQGQQQITDY